MPQAGAEGLRLLARVGVVDPTSLAAYRAAGNILGMMVVQHVPDAKAWGAVQVERDARGPYVTNILGDGEHMFCGVHVTRPSVMARLPDGESDSIRQGYLPWLRAGERVAAYEHTGGYFAEHSTPERYLESNWALLGGAALRHPPGPLVGVDASATIDPTATIVPPETVKPSSFSWVHPRVERKAGSTSTTRRLGRIGRFTAGAPFAGTSTAYTRLTRAFGPLSLSRSMTATVFASRAVISDRPIQSPSVVVVVSR